MTICRRELAVCRVMVAGAIGRRCCRATQTTFQLVQVIRLSGSTLTATCYRTTLIRAVTLPVKATTTEEEPTATLFAPDRPDTDPQVVLEVEPGTGRSPTAVRRQRLSNIAQMNDTEGPELALWTLTSRPYPLATLRLTDGPIIGCGKHANQDPGRQWPSARGMRPPMFMRNIKRELRPLESRD
jgi:hypothetical protein